MYVRGGHTKHIQHGTVFISKNEVYDKYAYNNAASDTPHNLMYDDETVVLKVREIL